MQKLIGTGVALVTPLKEDKSIDFQGLENLVNYQIENGVDYLVVLGTTSESATLTQVERRAVKNAILEINRNRVPLVLGVGGNCTRVVVEEIQQTNSLKFDAILSVSPYYNRPSQEGIYQHFRAVAEASKRPIILYNVPARTGMNLLPETILRLATNFDSIVGVKEAAGDMVQAMRILQKRPKGFLVISGDDMIALPMALAGGDGVISVLGGGFPKEFSKMIRLGLQGNAEQAYRLHYKLMHCVDLIFEEGNPAGIKTLLEQLQVIASNEVRLPLVKASQPLQKKITSFVNDFECIQAVTSEF